jgi:hypothetical protein
MTRKATLRRWTVALFENVGVVVRKLFSGKYVSNRLDPDSIVVDDCITVRVTGVIDEPRLIATNRSVDHDVIIDCEKIRVMSLRFFIRVASIGLRWRESLTCVLDQPYTSGNESRCERSQPLNRRFSNPERKNTGFSLVC